MLKLSVMVLESRLLQRSSAVHALKSLGVEQIFEAASEREALSVFAQHGAIDVLICELDVAGFDSYGVLLSISQAGRSPAIVLLSEQSKSEQSKQGLEALKFQLLGEIERPLVIQCLKELLQRFGENEVLPTIVTKTPRKQKPSQSEVEHGLLAGEFNAYFQPRVCLNTGEVSGMKVLMGWQNPQRGFIKESDCMPLLESYGLGDEVFIQLLRQGLNAQQQLSKDGKPVKLVMSLPGSQLISDELCKYVAASLALHQLPADGLMFEVRESCYLQSPTRAQANLVRLRTLGCELAIDSFKACYAAMSKHTDSTFAAIRLEAGPVRIHQQSVQKKSRDNLVLSEAANQGMDIVVEGVDTAGQRLQLSGIANVTAQGRLFAEPMSTFELREWLAS